MPLTILEERLSEFLSCRDTIIFPTGWAAGYGAVRTLTREEDHVVIDAAAAPCLHEGAVNATRNIHRVPNCSLDATTRILTRIRERDPRCGIMVVTEAFFPLEATIPDLTALLRACRQHEATLLVSIANDFGAIGEDGEGFAGAPGLAGEIDLLVGSFSRIFASNGGFVAAREGGIGLALRTFCGPLASSCALSPIQAAIAGAALDIVRSPEGRERRIRLMQNVARLRDGLAARAFRVLGQAGPSVPVWLGDTADARLMTRAVLAGGGLIDLVEPPDVPKGEARWCLYPMAGHGEALIDTMIEAAHAARETTGVMPPPPCPFEPRNDGDPD